MSSYNSSYHNYIELLLRILCDPVPQSDIDAIYLFGQTPDNESSVLNRGILLLKDRPTLSIFLPEGQPVSGYPGFDSWYKKLTLLGISPKKVIGLAVDHPSHQMTTLDEANALINFAKRSTWQKIIIVASPFHQPRSFITSVSVALRHHANLRIYNAVGESADWLATVVHSQGKLKAQRARLIHEELKKIEIYHQKGDLVSLEEILNYLNQRDSQ